MTHFRTPQGQFRKPTAKERVAAHVANINRRYVELMASLDSLEGKLAVSIPGQSDDHTRARFPEPPRSQPLEYDQPREGWLWLIAGSVVTFVLVVAIWVLLHG